MKKIFAGVLTLSFLFLNQALSVPKKSLPSDEKSQELWAELTGQDLTKLDDQGLYAEIVARYQTRDIKGMRRHLEAMLKRFPISPYADNALFLAGQMALELKNYSEALKLFHRIVQYYPQSNRAVSAQFAKGQAYRKMHLEVQAKKVFFEIRKKYPGSPESFRAENELRLLR